MTTNVHLYWLCNISVYLCSAFDVIHNLSDRYECHKNNLTCCCFFTDNNTDSKIWCVLVLSQEVLLR